MKTKWILTGVVLAAVFAAPGAPFAKWFEHRLADGRTVRIWGEGDEYGARFTDEAGRNLVYNPAIGNYEYAARESDETFREKVRARLREKAEATGLATRWAALKARAAARAAAASDAGPRKAPPSSPTAGRIVGVTILVDFPLLDADGHVTNTLAATAHPDVTADDLRALINGAGFTKYGNASSVREYYAEATSGHVDYTNVVIGWVQAPYPREHYDVATKDNGTCGRALIGDVFDVLAADISTHIGDLMQGTANASGEFLALNVLFAGPEATTWSYGLWAHQWVLASTQYNKLKITVGSKSYHFHNYQISPVTASPTIHTFCHENGHMICDFPDLYAYSSGLGNGVGNWCLMCGRTDDCHPQNFSAYLRAAAGWVTPKTLPAASGTLTVTADLQDVWKFPHPTDKKQYYLIENRQATGRDRELRASGIVIYRCDESGDNTTGAKTSKSVFKDYGAAVNRLSYEVSVEQADGLYEIEQDVRGKYNGDPNDTWHADNTADLYTGTFNATTTPCARWTDGAAAAINLSQFSVNGATMTFYSDAGDAEGDEGDGDSGDYSLTDAIYVNGVSTSAHTSGGGASSDATYWRVTDGRIVLRGGGPYVISGRGTMPVRCAVTDDAYSSCAVILSNLSIRSSDSDYAAFDCGTSTSAPVQMGLIGTNSLVSTAYSDKKSRPALGVTSGKTLTISAKSGAATLYCQGGKYAAGIGGGYEKGLLLVSDNNAGTVRVLGGTLVAQGGYNGAGIGGGNGGSGGRLDVYDSLVTATGGTGAAGIGGGYKGTGGHFFNYGGTVWAAGGLGDGTTPDIGRGKDSSSATKLRFYASGGSTTLANGYVTGMMTPSNATARVSRTVVPCLEPFAPCTFAGLPSDYGQRLIVANAAGEVHLWLPNGTYTCSSGDTDYAATVTVGKTTAAGSSDFGRWLKTYGYLDHDLPTWDERTQFKTADSTHRKPLPGGGVMTVFDEYVAGTVPTDPAHVFRATIRLEDGAPVVTPDPDLGAARVYTLWGVEFLGDPWHAATPADRFFKLEVSLPE